MQKTEGGGTETISSFQNEEESEMQNSFLARGVINTGRSNTTTTTTPVMTQTNEARINEEERNSHETTTSAHNRHSSSSAMGQNNVFGTVRQIAGQATGSGQTYQTSSSYGEAMRNHTGSGTRCTGRATGFEMRNEHEELYYGDMQILGEQVVEHEITVPVRKMVEEIIEKVVVIPEKVMREEMSEEKQTIRERIVQVAQPIEKIKYVDEVSYLERERIVHIPEIVEEERIVYQDKVVEKEVVRQRHQMVPVDKTVEYDVVEYRPVENVKTVVVPETKIIEKVVEKPINRVIEIEIPEYKEVQVVKEVTRNIPQPVQHVTRTEYLLPQIQTEYEEVPVPIFVPSFTQVPLPAEYLTPQALLEAEDLQQRISIVARSAMPSLCAVEELGRQARNAQPAVSNDPNYIQNNLNKKLQDHLAHNDPSKSKNQKI